LEVVRVVGDEEGGGVEVLEGGVEGASCLGAGVGVEGGEGFVEEEEPGLNGEGAREGDALAFAAGEGGCGLRGEVVYVEESEESEGLVAGVSGWSGS
jgi:hypothetical protein